MSSDSKPRFVHRENRDGTVDSVCMECYRTVASALNGDGLEKAEDLHKCDPLALERLKRMRDEDERR